MSQELLVDTVRGVGMLMQLTGIALFTGVAAMTPPVGVVAGAGVLTMAWHLSPQQNRASLVAATCAGVAAACMVGIS